MSVAPAQGSSRPQEMTAVGRGTHVDQEVQLIGMHSGTGHMRGSEETGLWVQAQHCLLPVGDLE